MSARCSKEAELSCLSRPTLQQLAKQHDVKANLKTVELIQALLEHFPCLVHSPECLLVLPLSDDSPSPPPSPTPSSPPTSFPPFPTLSISSHDLKARRKTWHKADLHIGDRLLSPTRLPPPPASASARRQSIRAMLGGVVEEGEEEEVGGERAEWERANTQPLIFSAVREEDGEVDREGEGGPAVQAAVAEQLPAVAPAPHSPPFVGFISARRGGGRHSTRPVTRTSSRLSTRRQTLAPPPPSSSTSPWPAPSSSIPSSTSTRRPLRPSSSILPPPRPSPARPRFDVAASLAKPVSWRMHRGPLNPTAATPSPPPPSTLVPTPTPTNTPTSTLTPTPRLSTGNPHGRSAKTRPPSDAAQGKENAELKRRKAMRQKSIDYARSVRHIVSASEAGGEGKE